MQSKPTIRAQVNAGQESFPLEVRLFIAFTVVVLLLGIGFVGWTILTAKPGPEIIKVDCPPYPSAEPDRYPLVCLS